jgi:TIR domain
MDIDSSGKNGENRMSVRSRAFISYSHTDAKHLRRLKVHLAPYIREKKVDVWDDTHIMPGARWKEEIKQAIAVARVAILLVSADFMASEFIARNELPPLLEAAEQQGTLILLVILSPCAFELSKLACYQSLNAPSSPLIKMPRWEQEAIWVKLAKHVTDALTPELLNGTPSQIDPPPEPVGAVNTQHDEGKTDVEAPKKTLTDLPIASVPNDVSGAKASTPGREDQYAYKAEEALSAKESPVFVSGSAVLSQPQSPGQKALEVSLLAAHLLKDVGGHVGKAFRASRQLRRYLDQKLLDDHQITLTNHSNVSILEV